MVAFNFKREFVKDIIMNRKRSTIRKSKRCKVGDTVQLYTGMRTKKCMKIADGVCIGTAHIDITDNLAYWSDAEGKVVIKHKDTLCEQEGFESNEEMISFFREHYGLPFKGYIHTWRLSDDQS